MDREEIIQNIVTCIESEGDGGCSFFTSEQKEAMKRFMDSVRISVRLDNKTIVEEVQKWMHDNCDSNGFFNQIELARHFAQWQMGKDLSSINKSYESGIVFGMNAQREQMLKDAVETEVKSYVGGDGLYVEIDLTGTTKFIHGQKVKVLFID